MVLVPQRCRRLRSHRAQDVFGRCVYAHSYLDGIAEIMRLALVSKVRMSRRPLEDILGQEEVPTVVLDKMDEAK